MRLSLHLQGDEVLKPSHLMNEVRRAKRDASITCSAHHNAQLNYCRINHFNKSTRICLRKKRGAGSTGEPDTPLHHFVRIKLIR